MTTARNPADDSPTISAIVLAGGQSTRLGRDKSFLIVDGVPLIERTVRILEGLSDDLIVVANDSQRYASLGSAARLVPDERPGVGALMGVYSGLKAARHDHALVLACDMPFLSLPLLRYMIALAAAHDVVIPRARGHLEPLHAIYGKACLGPMADLLDRDQLKIITFLDSVRVHYVEEAEIELLDPGHLSFLNVNTPADWARIRRNLGDARVQGGPRVRNNSSTGRSSPQ